MWKYIENRLKLISIRRKSLFRYTYSVLTCVFIISFSTDARGQCEVDKLTAHGGGSGDRFGYSVSISGEFALIGAYRYDGVGNNSGAAFVYTYHAESQKWIQQEILEASDPEPGQYGDLFGLAVSINGDVAVIGAVADNEACPGSPEFCNSGSAYVFRFDPKLSQWIEEDKLIASDGVSEDQFGTAVSICGDVAVVGVPYNDDIENNSGKAYVFRRDPKSSEWVEEAILTASDANAEGFFGFEVAIQDNVAVIIGRINNDDLGIHVGAAYVFGYDSETGEWIEKDKLIASDADIYDWFTSISLSENLAIIGAAGDDDAAAGINAGSAYVFKYDPKTELWTEVDKFYASDAEPNDQFGRYISHSGDLIVVSADRDDDACPEDPDCDSGSAYLFQYDPKTDSWIEKAKLTASDPGDGDEFGRSVSISGNLAIVGSHLDDELGTNAGAAYTFDLSACLCPADLDGDGTVNTTDLLALFAEWGKNPGNPADLDGNGTVNTTDLLILFANWGPCT